MRALITGGAGFIGSHLADALIERGDRVEVIDNLSTGRASNLNAAIAAGARLHEADVTDAARISALVEQIAPEVVFHLAAQIDVRRSVREVAFDARVNVEGTANVLEACRRAGTPRIVDASTGGAIYGEADVLPTPESHEARPLSPYGQSKYCAECYCGLYERLHGLSTIALRYGNVYGPRQDPLGEAGVVAIFCGKLLAGETATVNGDGRQTRDYVFVGDVVRANLAAAGRPDARGGYNIATGIETSVLDLVAALGALAAAAGLRTRHADAPAGEVERSCLDVTRARELLGWSARTSLQEGLRITLESARQRAPAAAS